MDHLAQLITVLNAALEHVPPNTRQILLVQAQQAARSIEEILKKADGQGH